jgi:hypothetical protein
MACDENADKKRGRTKQHSKRQGPPPMIRERVDISKYKQHALPLTSLDYSVLNAFEYLRKEHPKSIKKTVVNAIYLEKTHVEELQKLFTSLDLKEDNMDDIDLPFNNFRHVDKVHDLCCLLKEMHAIMPLEAFSYGIEAEKSYIWNVFRHL